MPPKKMKGPLVGPGVNTALRTFGPKDGLISKTDITILITNVPCDDALM
jgi:hypothetical protein